MKHWKRVVGSVAMVWLPWAGGCGGDARVELAAAQSVESLAASLDVALDEYDAEVGAGDDRREAAVIAAFVARVQAGGGDAAAAASAADDFGAALGKIRADRRVQWQRHTASKENVETLREVTAGLRQLAIASLTLSDEARRYLQAIVAPSER